MRKILFVHHKIGYGGANKMLIFVANSLAENPNNNVTIYTYASNDDSAYPLNENIKLIKSNKHTSLSNKHKLKQFISVKKLINESNPDVLISFMSTNNFFSIIGSLFSKTKVIISERGNPASEKGLYSKLKLASYRFADGIVFQTKGAQSFFSEKVKRKSIIIPNPVIDPKIEIGKWEDRRKEIAFVGRFDIRQKRQDLMIEAFSIISKKYPDYKLVFYGDGEEQEIIKNLAIELDVINSVEFKGRVNDVVKHISGARIFVMTSDFEGIPNALIEAMSIGLPCISTDCDPGGARLLIEDKKNGLLVEKNNVEQLALSMAYLIEDPTKADRLGDKAREINIKYDENSIKDTWRNIIEKTNR